MIIVCVCAFLYPVPAANVVIRFDPIQTPVSLVQSRGRARQADSSFVVLQHQSNKRSLQVMQTAEHTQSELLVESKKFNGGDENHKANMRRRKSQKSREAATLNFLKDLDLEAKNNTSSSQTLNTVVNKARGELSCDIQKCGQQWKCSLSALLPFRPCFTATSLANDKSKSAKSKASRKVLEQVSQALMNSSFNEA